MTIDSRCVGLATARRRITWDERDTMLYALGVGAGGSDLEYVTENSHGVTQRVLPTYAVIAADASAALALVGEIDMSRVVHGAQGMRLHGPLPARGAVDVIASVTSLVDKGAGGNAIIGLAAEARDAGTGELLVETTSTVVVKGAGGFGGDSGSRPSPVDIPDRAPDVEIEEAVAPDQALIYRLSGDRNPLHSDPWFARELAGFSAPILHGLCTYGFAGRALQRMLAGAESAGSGDGVTEMSASFAAPVFPGEVLTTQIWWAGRGALVFQTIASGSDHGRRVVLSRGLAR